MELLDTAGFLTSEIPDVPQVGPVNLNMSFYSCSLYIMSIKEIFFKELLHIDDTGPVHTLALQAQGNLVDLFCDLPWVKDAWPEAHLQECMFYLRRSKLIQLPGAFKDLIPASQFHLDQMIRGQ